VRFLVDAQLPTHLAELLGRAGHDAIHTTDLPAGNRSTDHEIARLADDDNRVVISKDRDFRDSHLLSRSPRRLLVVATGNITNNDLLTLMEAHLDAIISALETANFVELTQKALSFDPRRGGA
jgi:predicted nuclease of predicted toxin-antitoxin system